MIRILIIEDEPLVAQMYQKALAGNEFQVTIAIGGQEGIDMAKATKPDIILLDIMMPDPNGIEVLEKLKADETTRAIPVVALTNLSGKYDTAFTCSKGAVDYWVKSEVKLEEFGAKIKGVLRSNNPAIDKS